MKLARHLGIAVSLNVLVALACGVPAGAADSKYVTDAKSYLAKGELRAAEIQLKNALRENPNDLDARVLLGMVGMRAGDAAGAERTFKSALQQNGSREQILPLLGQSYLMQNKTRELLNELTTEGLSPDFAAQIADLRARAHLLQKSPQEAKKEAEAALALKPNMPEALVTLAILRRQAGDETGAEALLDQALKASPNNIAALDTKGEVRTAKGDPKGALEVYQKALAEQPDDARARLGVAAAQLALGDVDQSRKGVDDTLARSPGQPAALYLRAVILHREGKYADALQTLEPVASKFDDALSAQMLLGDLNFRTNHLDRAQINAERALALAPDTVSAKLLVALIYARKDQPQKVVPLMEPIAAKLPDNGPVHMILGDAYGRMGRFNDASRELEIALKAIPNDEDLRTRLAASRIGAGDQASGMKDLNDLLQADPQAKGASLLLISATMAQGRLEEAAKLAVDLRKTQSDNPLIDNLLGRIHWMMGDWAAAEADFKAALVKRPGLFEAANNLALLKQARSPAENIEPIYKAVLDADAKNVSAMIVLSDLARKKGDQDEALAWTEKAIAAAPEATPLRVRQIELFLSQKKVQEGLANAQTLVRSKPDDPQAVAALAGAQRAAGQMDAAILSLRRLGELQPSVAAGQYRLGQMLASLGRSDDARTAYRKAVESDPAFLPGWLALVSAETKASGIDNGLVVVKQAVALKAMASREDELKGEAYLAAGKFPEAKAAFQAVYKKTPDMRSLVRFTAAQTQAGDRTDTIATLADWLKSHPEDLNVRRLYAEALMANKDPAATREYETILAVKPTDIAVLNNLAWLESSSDPKKALALATRAYGLAPASPQVRDTLAWVLLQQGEVAQATTLLKLAHEQLPDNPDITFHLATALMRSGDIEGARALATPLNQVKGTFASQDEAKQLLVKLGSAK